MARRPSLRVLPLTGVLILSIVGPGAIALVQNPPREGEPVVVISAPWQTALSVASKADGRLVAPGQISSIALVWSDNPTFTNSLYEAGAWLVLGADASRFLCATE